MAAQQVSASPALEVPRSIHLLTGVDRMIGLHAGAQPGLEPTVHVLSGPDADVPAAPMLAEPGATIIHAGTPARSPPAVSLAVEVHRHTRLVQRLLRVAIRCRARRVVLLAGPGPGAPGREVEEVLELARREGLDVRRLVHGIPIGTYDVGPSWIGRAMVAFAAGRIRSFVRGPLSLVSAEDVGRALAALALDDTLPTGADFVLPSDVVPAAELLEMWADVVGPRCKPWARPAVASGLIRRWPGFDFDPRLAGEPTGAPAAGAYVMPRETALATSIERAYVWFSQIGVLRSARANLQRADGA